MSLTADPLADLAPVRPSRTPAEVLADGLFVLVRHDFFPSRERLAEAVRLVGLTMGDMAEAAIRLDNLGRYQPPERIRWTPPEAPRLAPVATPAPARTPEPQVGRSHGAHRPASAPLPAPVPEPTERTCERCERPKPVDAFVLRGTHRARKCRVCEWITGRRRRYEAALGAELLASRPVRLAPGDPLLGGECALDCGHPLRPGEPLLAVDVVLAHKRCVPRDDET